MIAALMQSRAIQALVVLVLLMFATLAGGGIEWCRAGGTRDLGQQLDAVRLELRRAQWQLAGARSRVDQHRRAAGAEHARADRERSRRLAAEHELAELRTAAVEQGRVAARAAEVVDIALWTAEHEPVPAQVWQPP